MNATYERTKTPHGFVITVFSGDKTIFQTLDDCFGKDRVRDWARKNKIVVDGLEA